MLEWVRLGQRFNILLKDMNQVPPESMVHLGPMNVLSHVLELTWLRFDTIDLTVRLL